MANRNRVLMLGLDALSRDIYVSLRSYGYFKSLDELAKRSIIGSINIIPPYTPQAWTSITSGVNPGKHAIYGFICDYLGRDNARLCRSTDVMAPRVHNIASYSGLKSLIVNLPFSSWPYIPFRGYLIADWTSPVQYARPQFLDEVFKKNLAESQKTNDDICKLLAHDLAILKTLISLGDKIIGDVDYAFIMFSFIDEIMHKYPNALFPPRYECIREVLELFDEFVKEVLWPEFLDKHLVLLVSDHGIDKVNYIVSLPRILYEHGLVRMVYRGLEEKNSIASNVNRKAEKKLLAKLISKLIRNEKLSRVLIPLGRRLIRKISSLHSLAVEIERPVVDPVNSIVIIPNMSYALYINENKVDNIDETISRVINVLNGVQEELGHQFIYTITPGRGYLYKGEYSWRAPHIVIVPRRGYSFKSGLNVLAPIIEKPAKSLGDHHVENMHMISVGGNNHLEDAARKIMRPCDYAILALLALRLPLPHDTDSKIHNYVKKENGVNFVNYKVKYMITLKLAQKNPLA